MFVCAWGIVNHYFFPSWLYKCFSVMNMVAKTSIFVTGDMGEAAWSPDNKRISGNRVLFSARTLEESCPFIR